MGYVISNKCVKFQAIVALIVISALCISILIIVGMAHGTSYIVQGRNVWDKKVPMSFGTGEMTLREAQRLANQMRPYGYEVEICESQRGKVKYPCDPSLILK